MNPPVDPAAELARLRRKSTIWTWVAVAGVILTVWAWFGAPLCRAPAPARTPPPRAVVPSAPVAHPSYVKLISATPEGPGFIVSFVLADASGSPVRSSGVAVAIVFDEYYGHAGPDMDQVLQRTFPVDLDCFSPTTNGYVACFLPRLDLTKASFHSSTTGAFVKLWFIVDGDTLRTATRAPWPF